MDTIAVTLTPSDAAEVVMREVTSSGVSVECVGMYRNDSGDGREVVMLVFEKYFMRNSSRASLSVVIENLTGTTWVGASGSGGGQSSHSTFDWGSGAEFSASVTQALKPYEAR